MHTDITARKQAEKDLARAEERYRTVADYTYNWETWIRADGGYEYISPACARITGYSADEFLNDPSLSERIVHRDDRHIWQSHFGGQEKGRTASAGQQIEFRIIRRDGEARWIQHVCVAVVDDKGRFLGYRGSNRDITENKADEARIIRYNQEITRQAKALRAANAEMEAFSYSVSHDLRAPLRSIDGFSQALLEDGGLPPDSTARDYLSRIRKATRNMSELIDALLRLSRMDNRETALETVDLSGLAGGLWEKLKAAYPGRRIEFSVQPGLAVRADRQLIEIALYNILDNACKFTAEREPATIELGSVPAGPERVFHVRDNGIGFEPAAAEDIFIPFQRAHQDGRFGGSGIGLSIVRRAIRRHHGRVWAESRPGVGTTVFFTLPDGTGSGTA